MISGLNRKIFNQLSYGLYVVTSQLNGKFGGLIVNTVLQVTWEPPRIAVIISKDNFTHDFIMKSRVFGASVLEVSTPMTFIGLFGFKSSRDVDKLSRVEYVTGSTGCPLVTEHALSIMEAKVIDDVDVGSHTLFVGEVLSGDVIRSGEPMTYLYYRTHLKGKSPKNAPTWNPDSDRVR